MKTQAALMKALAKLESTNFKRIGDSASCGDSAYWRTHSRTSTTARLPLTPRTKPCCFQAHTFAQQGLHVESSRPTATGLKCRSGPLLGATGSKPESLSSRTTDSDVSARADCFIGSLGYHLDTRLNEAVHEDAVADSSSVLGAQYASLAHWEAKEAETTSESDAESEANVGPPRSVCTPSSMLAAADESSTVADKPQSSLGWSLDSATAVRVSTTVANAPYTMLAPAFAFVTRGWKGDSDDKNHHLHRRRTSWDSSRTSSYSTSDV